jgi:putative transcriptional regulator
MEDKVFLKQLGEKIVAIREKKGISQMELARRLDTGNNQIRRIEKGLVAANIITLRRIASEIGVPLIKLIKF